MRYHPLAIVLACGAGTASAQSTYEVPGDLPNLTTALNPSVTPVEAGDTIRLTDPLADLPGDFDPFHTGNFTVSIADLTIESVAGETVVIDGGNAGTVITVTEEGSGLTLRNVIIENGVAPGDGGGVHALAADLMVEDCVFRNNTAQDDGGAILSDQGALTIRRTRFENNHALGTGGSGDADGGAIFKFEGNLTIEGSDAGDPDTANSVFINNSSDDVGGAVSADFVNDLNKRAQLIRWVRGDDGGLSVQLGYNAVDTSPDHLGLTVDFWLGEMAHELSS